MMFWQVAGAFVFGKRNVNNRGGSFATLLGRHPGSDADGADSLDTS
jgi:hypothetical protein